MDRREFLKGMTIASISPLAAYSGALNIQPDHTIARTDPRMREPS